MWDTTAEVLRDILLFLKENFEYVIITGIVVVVVNAALTLLDSWLIVAVIGIAYGAAYGAATSWIEQGIGIKYDLGFVGMLLFFTFVIFNLLYTLIASEAILIVSLVTSAISSYIVYGFYLMLYVMTHACDGVE